MFGDKMKGQALLAILGGKDGIEKMINGIEPKLQQTMEQKGEELKDDHIFGYLILGARKGENRKIVVSSLELKIENQTIEVVDILSQTSLGKIVANLLENAG
jgi:hypothetical protein